MKFKKGFTLLELLVVIAIIGILSSVALSSLAQARTSAARAELESHLVQLGRAMELYRFKYGEIPTTIGTLQTINDIDTTNGASGDAELARLLTDGFIEKIGPGDNNFVVYTNDDEPTIYFANRPDSVWHSFCEDDDDPETYCFLISTIEGSYCLTSTGVHKEEDEDDTGKTAPYVANTCEQR